MLKKPNKSLKNAKPAGPSNSLGVRRTYHEIELEDTIIDTSNGLQGE